MRRGLVLILVLLIAGSTAAYFVWGTKARQARVAYVTETIDRGPITTVVTATGTVNPVTTVQVGTYVSGPIIAIDVDFNSPVRRGQRVAKIDPAPFEVKVRKAEANLTNARARVEKSRVDMALKRLTLERFSELLEGNLVAQSEVDVARSDFEQARAQLALEEAAVQQARADLEDARINLAYTDIRSPVDGVVVARNVDVGQTVAASFQTPTLFLIAQDLTKMQVNTAVSESDIGRVRDGQPATFTVDAYGSRTFAGTVIQVRNAPTVVQNVVTYDVVVAVDNAGLDLKPGMTATVSITTAQRDDVLRIAARALRFQPESSPDSEDGTPGAKAAPSVWVVEEGAKLRRVEIEIGLRNDRHAEVLRGDVQPGMQIAVGMPREERAAARPPSIPGAMRYR